MHVRELPKIIHRRQAASHHQTQIIRIGLNFHSVASHAGRDQRHRNSGNLVEKLHQWGTLPPNNLFMRDSSLCRGSRPTEGVGIGSKTQTKTMSFNVELKWQRTTFATRRASEKGTDTTVKPLSSARINSH
jgi:hypothetical protein